MKRLLRRLLIGIIVLLLIAGGIYLFAPWKGWVGEQLIATLKEQNLPVDGLVIDEVTPSYAEVSQINIALLDGISIPSLRIHYSPASLMDKRIQSIELRDMVLNFSQKPDDGAPATAFALPLPKHLRDLPLQEVRIENAKIILGGKDWSGSVPFNVTMIAGDTPSIKITGEAAEYKLGRSGKYAADRYEVVLNADGDAWKGEAVIHALSDSNGEAAWLPVKLSGQPHISMEQGLRLPLRLNHADYMATAVLAAPLKGDALLQDTQIQVADGKLGLSPINLAKTDDLRVTMNAENVSLEKLLGFMLGDDEGVKATGKITGSIPVRYTKETLTIGKGALHSVGGGTLSLGAAQLAALPTGITQVEQVSALLKKFDYTSLELTTQGGEAEAFAIKAALKGRNADVFGGQEVHLNVTLQGDVMEAITSSMGLYTLPDNLIKGESK